MKRFLINTLVVTTILGVLAWGIFHVSVARELAKRHIAPLPDSSVVFGSNSGGLFASWLFVATTMNSNDYSSYKNTILSDAETKYHIPNQALVLKLEDSKTISDERIKVFLKQKVNGSYLSWWNTDNITKGVVCEKNLGNDCRYTIYFDDDKKSVFIYWSYS
jgi:hypothetical protein